MPSDLDFLGSLSEKELIELVLLPLLEAMGYTRIRKTHGPDELGKDIVFCEESPLRGRQYDCAVVKKGRLKGAVGQSMSIRTVYDQVDQALTHDYTDPDDMRKRPIKSAFIITSGIIDPTTSKSIEEKLRTNADRVEFIDGAKLVDLLKKHCPTLLESLPDDQGRYLHVLTQRFMHSSVLSKLGSDSGHSFEKIYTGGDISPLDREEACGISFAVPYEIEERLHPAGELEKHRNIVIVADVGAGKTSLLQRCFVELASRFRSEKSSHCLSPVFFSLSWLSAELRSSDDVPQSIAETLHQNEQYSSFRLEDLGSYLLLLDGFDEIAADAELVESAISELSKKAGGLVVTTRPTRVPELYEFSYYRLNPFSNEQIDEFVGLWFPQDGDLRNELLTRIRSNETLLQFCRTPLMLTLYAILAKHTAVSQLPERRSALYERIVNLLLGEWDRMREVKSDFQPDTKSQVLSRVAYESWGHVGFRAYTFFDQIAVAPADYEGRQRAFDAEALLDEILFRSALIVEDDEHSRWNTADKSYAHFKFVHLSFQEFFAAVRLRDLGRIDKVEEILLDPRWRNLLQFYFGLTRTMDGIRLTRRIRRRVPRSGLRLVGFLLEADFTDVKQRRVILKWMAQDVLVGPQLTHAELRDCARLGNHALVAIEKEINRPGFEITSPSNYFEVLLSIGSNQALKAAVQVPRLALLERCSIKTMIGFVERLIIYPGPLRATGRSGAYRTIVSAATSHLKSKLREVNDPTVGLAWLARLESLRERFLVTGIDVSNDSTRESITLELEGLQAALKRWKGNR